jgi:hypothetical protein
LAAPYPSEETSQGVLQDEEVRDVPVLAARAGLKQGVWDGFALPGVVEIWIADRQGAGR